LDRINNTFHSYRIFKNKHLKHGTGGNERTNELGGVANNCQQKTGAVVAGDLVVVGQVMELGREK